MDMNRITQLGLVVAAFLAVSGSATLVEAQAPSRGGRAPRIITLDEFRIEGRVQRPNAFYILNRSSIGYEVLDLRTTFTREIIRSVQGEPF